MNTKGSIIAAIGAVAALLTVAVSWTTLGWERPAFTSDLKPITAQIGQARPIARSALQLARSNNRRILQNDWWRYDRDIEETKDAIKERPKDRRLKDSLRRLRRERAEIQDQIDKLD